MCWRTRNETERIKFSFVEFRKNRLGNWIKAYKKRQVAKKQNDPEQTANPFRRKIISYPLEFQNYLITFAGL